MADLPSVKKKINDIQVAANAPHSESLMVDIGGSINYILDSFAGLNNYQILTASGNFTVPDDVNRIFILGCGGGGGGGGGPSTAGFSGGGGGSGGEFYSRSLTGVTPGGSIAYTIGASGSGGAFNNPGGNGGSTVFSSITFRGGIAGGSYNQGTPAPGGVLVPIIGGFNANGGDGGVSGFGAASGETTIYGAGGANGTPLSAAGGGGGAALGAGAAGGNTNTAGASAGANTGGGGGGGGARTSGPGVSGGSGGSGVIVVLW